MYLVDLNRNELVGKIYDSKNKKRYNMTSNLARYTSESSSNQFFLVDEEFKLLKLIITKLNRFQLPISPINEDRAKYSKY